jgi:ketosteroid isomerase-like protein
MADAQSELLALENRRITAMNTGDTDALLALLHDDHVHVLANGLVTDKAGAARALENTPRRMEPRSPLVRVYGDVAILTGPQVSIDQIDGKPHAARLFLTQVARRADGAWKFASMHAVRLPG